MLARIVMLTVRTVYLLMLLGLGAGWLRLPASAVPHAPQSIRLEGREYVRLSEWAKANGLELGWLKPEESLQLSNRSVRLVLTLDSREAKINGIQVVLLFPVLMKDNLPCIAQLDVTATLRPLLNPPKNTAGTPIRTICLDPGHGGKDPGNHVGAREEKHYTLLLATELRNQLTQAGFKVILTRSTDSFVELSDRPELARRRAADLFVSLHFNAAQGSSPTARGAEVYCFTPEGAPSSNAGGEASGAGSSPGNRQNDKNVFFAYQLQRALVRGLGVDDRGVRRARFAVLRDATMPAVLVEAGFMSHPAESRKIFDAAYRRQIARALTEGLLAYKRVVDPRAP